MKSKADFPKDWQIITLAAILFFLALQSCKTTKDLHQVKNTESSVTKTDEHAVTNTQAETNTVTNASAETRTTENCDTIITVNVPVIGRDSQVIAYKSMQLQVKFKRTTDRKEYTQQKEQKKEKAQAVNDRNVLQKTESEQLTMDKHVERSGVPVLWPIILGITVILLAVLIWRLKLF